MKLLEVLKFVKEDEPIVVSIAVQYTSLIVPVKVVCKGCRSSVPNIFYEFRVLQMSTGLGDDGISQLFIDIEEM